MRIGCLLDIGEDAAGLGGQRVACGIDRPDPVEARQREHDSLT